MRGNRTEDCELGLFQDASFASDLRDSNQRLEVHTCVPISWMCKKQTTVCHSSAESEIISLDAGLRMDGLPALQFWECVLETILQQTRQRKLSTRTSHVFFFESIDHVPANIPNTWTGYWECELGQFFVDKTCANKLANQAALWFKWCPLLLKLLSCTAFTVPKTMVQKMTEAECIDKMWDQYSYKKCWNQGSIVMWWVSLDEFAQSWFWGHPMQEGLSPRIALPHEKRRATFCRLIHRF